MAPHLHEKGRMSRLTHRGGGAPRSRRRRPAGSAVSRSARFRSGPLLPPQVGIGGSNGVHHALRDFQGQRPAPVRVLRVLAGQGVQVDTTTAAGRLVLGIFAALAAPWPGSRPRGLAGGRAAGSSR